MGKNGRQPTYDKAVAVANALGVSADYLLTGEQKEKPASEEAGFHPTLEDWLGAIDRMSREDMRAAVRSFASNPPPWKANARIIL